MESDSIQTFSICKGCNIEELLETPSDFLLLDDFSYFDFGRDSGQGLNDFNLSLIVDAYLPSLPSLHCRINQHKQ